MPDLDAGMLALTLAANRATFVSALGRGDADALAALYAADATLLPPGATPISGREAIRRFWQAGLNAGIVGLRLEAARLDQDTRLAYELGRYELRLEPAASKPVIDRGNYMLVHARQTDDSWLRRVEFFTPACRPA